MLQRLGKGTFGLVTKARQRSSGKLVALKKFIVHDRKDGFPITSFREITIMKKLRHENVLQLVDMVHERGSDGKALGFFYTVTPYISSDLNGLLNNPRVSLNIPQIKCIIRQSLQGIDYVHSQHYLHRDIKTANILLDFFGVVKLADFGLARVYHGPLPMTPNSPPGGGWYEYTGLVVTRWYRPPELLLGERKYTTAVDMWGMGCVLGEMYKRKPILEGESDLDQADRIFRLVGSPTEETFPNYEQTNRNNVNVKVNYDRTLEKEYSDIMDEGAIELLSGLLTLDPQRRFNAKKALESRFFTSEPLPCQPAELPKFEESHESDIKRFKHEAQSSVSASRSLDHSRYGAPEMERAASYQSSEQGGAVMESRYIPQQGDYHSGGSWTANRRRGGGYGRVQNEVYKEELPSSKAHGADLYGAEEDKSFSEMKRFLHHEKRQKTTE
ncbi:DEKNAAC103663 [Brettanomyces naardenensis]|uniref:Serine/threonine-protein kinase BUR1 n=1 Tax=Brettanomyces naardenensis TaxID=13370 RepID=A0A448YN35_BRENA|nr:DEKNAAC103663 [Brettanomyces naardenensis]